MPNIPHMDALKKHFSQSEIDEMFNASVDASNLPAPVVTNKLEGVAPIMAEFTRYGEPWQQRMRALDLGRYHIDDIPLATYGKMRWDGQLRLGLMTIKLPIISRSFWVECEDKDVACFVEEALGKIWRDLLKSLLLALDFGFAVVEKVWHTIEGMRVTGKQTPDGNYDVSYALDSVVYKKFKSLHPETITIEYDEKQSFMGFTQNKDQPGIEVFVPAAKAFVFTHDKEFGNMYGYSRLKPAYPYWYTYWIIDAWHERWLQNRGTPPIVVYHPVGRSIVGTDDSGKALYKDNSDLAKDVGKQIGPDSVITVPSNKQKSTGVESEWRLDQLTDTTLGRPFIEAKEMLDIRKLRSILVPERSVTEESGGGAARGTEQHVWLMLEGLKGILADVEECINRYIIPDLVGYNFGMKAPDARLRIERIGRELSGFLYQLYHQMVVSGLAQPSVKKLEEVLDIPAASVEERQQIRKIQAANSMGLGPMAMGNPFARDSGAFGSMAVGGQGHPQAGSQQAPSPQAPSPQAPSPQALSERTLTLQEAVRSGLIGEE